jgi:hypothetical protein
MREPRTASYVRTMFHQKARHSEYIQSYEWYDVYQVERHALGWVLPKLSCTSYYATNDINHMWFNHTTIVQDLTVWSAWYLPHGHT